jgi:predicted Rossmann-fold nucleotide-binding protein
MPATDLPEYVQIPMEVRPFRVIVCGGRDYRDFDRVHAALDAAHKRRRIGLIVHGGAPGADTFADEWAAANGVPVKTYAAEWERLGAGAGPRRNQQMADAGADALIAFPGGRGTADMVRRAIAARIVVWKPFG